jgi:FKBP-type peptidyl-prolyl cis-trans isomerase 2
LIIIVLVVVGIVSALGYSWYTDSQKEPKKETQKDLRIREGDLITCDFTEYIWSRDSTGTLTYSVYQTTLDNVASDESIPKSVTFQKILTNGTGGSITRDRLTAIVGKDLISEMNEGFNQLVFDMEVDETKTKEISSKLGYGERNESLVQSIPLLDKIPIYETINRASFEAEYPEEVPLEPGKSFKHRYWDWYIRISSISAEEVVIKHEPEIGQDIDIFSWTSSVENVSSKTGLIWIRHRPTQDIVNSPIDAEVLEYYNPVFTEIKQKITETQQPYPGIILSIQNGIEIDFNRENIGKNLKYEITIIKIERD